MTPTVEVSPEIKLKREIHDLLPKQNDGRIVIQFREDWSKIEIFKFTVPELLQLKHLLSAAAKAYYREQEAKKVKP